MSHLSYHPTQVTYLYQRTQETQETQVVACQRHRDRVTYHRAGLEILIRGYHQVERSLLRFQETHLLRTDQKTASHQWMVRQISLHLTTRLPLPLTVGSTKGQQGRLLLTHAPRLTHLLRAEQFQRRDQIRAVVAR